MGEPCATSVGGVAGKSTPKSTADTEGSWSKRARTASTGTSCTVSTSGSPTSWAPARVSEAETGSTSGCIGSTLVSPAPLTAPNHDTRTPRLTTSWAAGGPSS